VDNENQRNFDAIASPMHKFTAVDTSNDQGRGTFFENFKKECQAKEVVELKVGAQILLLKNLDTNAGLCNGSRGVVIDFVEYRAAAEQGEIQLSGEDKATFGNYLRANKMVPIVMFANVLDGGHITRVLMPETFEKEVDKVSRINP
jgi:hypothetical protein